ncbi:TetR/AcrR family transcriptional regulator [Liquorilactobacillus uvarum]|uniref:TetR/AcrR family transcriptional regulator n=1 Tax=Liquorilactobacillus uvarum TaxID=303240 RepID=UPI00288BDC0C|nr:TetR/AcrR family transcriptional regulator [Liquorilactobacillus uvarum]
MLTNKLNPQVRRTHEWTFKALMFLLREKDFDKITIKEITAKAGIARQTFYRNYTDKNDIVQKYIDIIFIDFVKQFDEKKKSLDRCQCYFRTLKNYQQSLIELTQLYDPEVIYKTFSKYLDVFIEFLKRKEPPEKVNQHPKYFKKYQIMYQVGGAIFITAEWVKEKMEIPVEEMAITLDAISRSNYFYDGRR